jgi:hypothetical protein
MQPEKDKSPILVTLSGRKTDASEVHPKNALLPILIKPGGRTTSVREVHPEKADVPILTNPSSTNTRELREVHPLNAEKSILFSDAPFLITTSVRDEQPVKVEFSIRVSRSDKSNALRAEQPLKADGPSVVKLFGRMTDRREVQRKNA